MNVFQQYLYCAFLSSLTVLVSGMVTMPDDCGQCVLLYIVGSGLMFLAMLLLTLPYFLLRVNVAQWAEKIILGIIATLTPPILLAGLLLKYYYDPDRYDNSDFEVFSPAVITAFIVGVWTFYIYMRKDEGRSS
ncbi:hypothetical protein [Pseudochryseolinea flava]|uniref:Uncharacterized protein n=1 Tax=Pseudochryseolinea flava TaxID=2059302 RepID=A0A364Y2J7_9BACT|nr:hypothetical protein [Pseudochryseolinea flava]RAW01000.1 hypothetical protein DQQ10_12260 [Pseudochryseolinea flava]